MLGITHARQDDDAGGLIADMLRGHDAVLAEFANWAMTRVLRVAYPRVEIGCRQAEAFGRVVREYIVSCGYPRAHSADIVALRGLALCSTPGGNCAAEMAVVRARLTGAYANAYATVAERLQSEAVRTDEGDLQWYVLRQLFRLLWMAVHPQMRQHLQHMPEPDRLIV